MTGPPTQTELTPLAWGQETATPGPNLPELRAADTGFPEHDYFADEKWTNDAPAWSGAATVPSDTLEGSVTIDGAGNVVATDIAISDTPDELTATIDEIPEVPSIPELSWRVKLEIRRFQIFQSRQRRKRQQPSVTSCAMRGCSGQLITESDRELPTQTYTSRQLRRREARKAEKAAKRRPSPALADAVTLYCNRCGVMQAVRVHT